MAASLEYVKEVSGIKYELKIDVMIRPKDEN